MSKPKTEINPITELMKEAMRTAYDDCAGPEGCLHQEPVLTNMDGITNELREAVVDAAQNNQDPIFSAYFRGFHQGYRLAQLMFAQTTKEKSN